MARIGNPMVKYNCDGCGHWVERQISARRAAQELDELRDEPQLYCAGCACERLLASAAR